MREIKGRFERGAVSSAQPVNAFQQNCWIWNHALWRVREGFWCWDQVTVTHLGPVPHSIWINVKWRTKAASKRRRRQMLEHSDQVAEWQQLSILLSEKLLDCHSDSAAGQRHNELGMSPLYTLVQMKWDHLFRMLSCTVRVVTEECCDEYLENEGDKCR